MQVSEAMKLRAAMPQCEQHTPVKEYDRGAQRGDWVCETCGQHIAADEVERLRNRPLPKRSFRSA